jgi:hypothetical protein
MPVFAEPRHPLVEKAVIDARDWCFDHELDGKPAFARATRVVLTLEEHLGADLTPELAAAALLRVAHPFAPAEIDTNDYLLKNYSSSTRRILRALQTGHEALATAAASIDTADLQVLFGVTADTIVAFHLLLEQARKSGDEARFFTSQTDLHRQLDRLKQYQQAILGRVPESMSRALNDVLTAVTACRTA